MAILFDDKYIFYHICKTGGTSVVSFIYDLTKNHRKLFRDLNHIPSCGYAQKSAVLAKNHCGPLDIKDHDGKTSFVTIRHPIGWYESVYKRGLEGRQFFVNNYKIAETFDQFVTSVLRLHPYGFVTSMYSRYFPFVDYVVKLEQIDHELPQLFKVFGYKDLPPVPKKNVSPIKKYDLTLDQKTRQNLIDIEWPIIDRFYHGANR